MGIVEAVILLLVGSALGGIAASIMADCGGSPMAGGAVAACVALVVVGILVAAAKGLES